MSSARKNPWRKGKNKKGETKFYYDFQDADWGVEKRIRRIFNTAKEAEAFHKAVLNKAMSLSSDEKPERQFGEAIIEYIEQIEKEGKLSSDSDKTDITALRWPFQYRNQFYRLEELVMNDKEMGIIWGIQKYLLDLSNVVRRSYINNGVYHLRREPEGLVWYEQPNPSDNIRPKQRQRVTSLNTLKKLDKSKGRGPFPEGTLHRRKSIAKTILRSAWHDWRWLDKDLSTLIKLGKPGKGRIAFLTSEQYQKLLSVVDEDFAYLIRGGKSIGWRRENLIGLTWDRVVFPEQWTDNNEKQIKIPGYLRIDEFNRNYPDFDPSDRTQRRNRTKNKDALETIMTPEIEALLRELLSKRKLDNPIVFPNYEGKYWKDFRKRWTTAKNRAGIPESFRWHDLRHTWATDRINEGVPDLIIMEEQGWKDPEMVRRYGHLQKEARYSALKKASSGN